MATVRAVLYIPAGLDVIRWLGQLTDWATAREIEASTYTRSWPELVELLATGQADVGVVWTRGHLPPDRLPRVIVTDEEPVLAPPVLRPRWRR